ncbi:MAG: DUF4349 domain-containing protein [bacterium]
MKNFLMNTIIFFLMLSMVSCSAPRKQDSRNRQKPQSYRRFSRGESATGSDERYSTLTSSTQTKKVFRQGSNDRADMNNKRERKSVTKDKTHPPEKETKTDRMVIRTGKYRIRVNSVKDAVRRINILAGEHSGEIKDIKTSGGYSKADIIIKVPVENFFELMDTIEKTGKIISRNISAEDVTRKFRDVMLRKKTLQKILERLQAILETTESAEEKISVLKEIERIEQKLAAMKAKADYYKENTAFSTIHITLFLHRGHGIKRYIPSPFPWIRSLSPNGRYNVSVCDDIKTDIPETWFSQVDAYDKKKIPWMYSAPGNSVKIRAGTVENYPEADTNFWKQAVEHDFIGRDYEKISHQTLKSDLGEVYVSNWQVSSDVQYMLGFLPVDEGSSLFVIEVLFHSEDKMKKQKESVESFIKSVRWK